MKKSKYSREVLEQVIKKSTSWSDVCRNLGVKPATGSQTYIRKRADLLKIDSKHFLGQAWSRGKTFTKLPIEEYLVVCKLSFRVF